MLGSSNNDIDPYALLDSSGVEILLSELLDSELWRPVELLTRAEELLTRLAATGPDGDPAHLALRAKVAKSLMMVGKEEHELFERHATTVCRLLDAVGEALRSVIVSYARDADFWMRWYVGPWRNYRRPHTEPQPTVRR
jgi:hypothetical protein